MDNITSRPFDQGTSGAVDRAADTHSGTILATQDATSNTSGRLSDTVDSVHKDATPLISALAGKAENAARRGTEIVRATSAQVRDRANLATDATIGFIKEEPFKAILFAAATGAALIGLLNLTLAVRESPVRR